ncbi:unnamed protein product [Polarella glacialis]|uniref:Uncharacterized protein n=1 Tax=Polarella glacialis TaxID=89957 RepID=A0A813LR65_POLGL|nr:unnamed protein product [Polarella glacialis]
MTRTNREVYLIFEEATDNSLDLARQALLASGAIQPGPSAEVLLQAFAPPGLQPPAPTAAPPPFPPPPASSDYETKTLDAGMEEVHSPYPPTSPAGRSRSSSATEKSSWNSEAGARAPSKKSKRKNTPGTPKEETMPAKDPFQTTDPWAQGAVLDPPATNNNPRALELDPLFVKHLVGLHKVTAVACNEESTDWSYKANAFSDGERPVAIVPSNEMREWRSTYAWQTFLDVMSVRDPLPNRLHPGDGSAQPCVWLIRTPPWTKQAIIKFATSLEKIWTYESAELTIVAISLVAEVPGSWKLWQHIAPNEWLKTSISGHIHSLQVVDMPLLHRLHGANNTRGWDPRAHRAWITTLRPHVASSIPDVELADYGRPQFSLVLAAEDQNDFLMLDLPEQPRQELPVHASLRADLAAFLGIDELNIQSEKKNSPGSTRQGRRNLHTFSVPRNSASQGMVAALLSDTLDPRGSPAAFQSVLRAGPVYLLRATHQHVLIKVLGEMVLLSSCFAAPSVLAFVLPPESAEHIVEYVQNFETEDGALLQLSLTGEGTLWPAFGQQGRRGGLTYVADTLKVIGLPALWGKPHYDSFFDLLTSQNLFLGAYEVARPQRPDGSLMDLTKLVCSLASSVTHLAEMTSIRIEQLDLSTIEIKFERISDRFDWRLPDDTEWTQVADGHCLKTHRQTRSADDEQ